MAKQTKAIRTRDLKDQIGVPGPHPFLYCATCGAKASANAGDYSFWRKPEEPFMCCGRRMILATERCEIREVG